MEKDGEVTIATIVAIALAVVLLVFLVYGFSVGWGNFWDKITDFGGNNVNLDTIRQACSMACMLGGGSDFCVQERSLTIQKGKTTLGSCFDFSEKNPSLGIEECDTCSMASGGCTVGGALDENCDGVSDKVDEVTGEDLLSISMEELLYFEDSEDSEIYSEEECVSGLEQRKIALEIPDKLCYWEAMSEVYDEKCENLNNEDISKIFENKKEYRELNNPNWPSLNTDGDFCVPVIYDCGEWSLRIGGPGDIFGFLNPNERTVKKIDEIYETSNLTKGIFYQKLIRKSSVSGSSSGEIQINPYRSMDKSFVLNSLLLHEGLHSIQTDMATYSETIYLPLLEEGIDPSADGFLEMFPDQGVIIAERDVIHTKLSNYFYLLKVKNSGKSFDGIQEYLENSLRLNPISFEDYVSSESYYYGYFFKEEYLSLKSELDNYLLTDQVKELKGLLLAYTEVSKISELDPRLSEVHRYWFDKTAPSCEVLDTPERFGDALGQFLNESSIPEEYGVTQKQLKSVLEIAENMGEMEEIWNQLIGRGPGLASADDYSSDERYA